MPTDLAKRLRTNSDAATFVAAVVVVAGIVMLVEVVLVFFVGWWCLDAAVRVRRRSESGVGVGFGAGVIHALSSDRQVLP